MSVDDMQSFSQSIFQAYRKYPGIKANFGLTKRQRHNVVLCFNFMDILKLGQEPWWKQRMSCVHH